MTSHTSPSPRRSPQRLWLAAVAALAVAAPVLAQVVVAPDDTGKIVLRAASYDRNLADRAGSTVVIGVVSRAGAPASVADAGEMADAFRALAGQNVGGLKTKVVSWPIINANELAARLSESHAAVLYIAGGFEPAELEHLAAAAEKAHALCTYRSPAYDGVLALGVLHLEDRVRLVVNLAAAKRAGVDFDSQLLRLALIK